MPSIKKALKKPFEDLGKLSIGSVLMMVPIVNFIAYGYALLYANSVMRGKDRLPEWKDWGKLFSYGLKMVVASLIYSLPLILVIILFFMSVGMSLDPQGVQFAAPLGVIYALFGLMVFLAVLTFYTTPVLHLALARDFDVKKALNVRGIFLVAFRWNYFKTFIKAMIAIIVLSFAVGIVAGLTEFTIVLPLVLNAYLTMACQIVYFHMFSNLAVESKKR